MCVCDLSPRVMETYLLTEPSPLPPAAQLAKWCLTKELGSKIPCSAQLAKNPVEIVLFLDIKYTK